MEQNQEVSHNVDILLYISLFLLLLLRLNEHNQDHSQVENLLIDKLSLFLPYYFLDRFRYFYSSAGSGSFYLLLIFFISCFLKFMFLKHYISGMNYF